CVDQIHPAALYERTERRARGSVEAFDAIRIRHVKIPVRTESEINRLNQAIGIAEDAQESSCCAIELIHYADGFVRYKEISIGTENQSGRIGEIRGGAANRNKNGDKGSRGRIEDIDAVLLIGNVQ